MVKKNKQNIICTEKSIYYDLKEFHDRNTRELYSYQDFETAGIKEYKSITNKSRPIQEYEKNRLADELAQILFKDISNEEKIEDVTGFITLNPVINYYENIIKFFKVSLDYNNFNLQMKDIISKMVTSSGCSEIVKLGLLLAPISKIENIEEILDIFAIHNEYLFYVIKAYEYIGNNNNLIFRISKQSKGYGKVFCVMNLCPTTYEIKKWVIEESCDNNVGVVELLSYGILSIDLLEYLENIQFDKDELEILARSFSILLSDYGLDDIKDSVRVCNKLLNIIDELNGGIYSLYAIISIIYSIETIIIDDYKNKKSPVSYKFDNEYKNIIEKCKEICKKDIWHKIIAEEASNIEIESSVIISCAEKTKYRLRKKEYEALLKRDYTNALLYKYAFSIGNRAIKKCALELGLHRLPMDQIFRGQDELKIENLDYDDIVQICFFIIIKYSRYDDFQDSYKTLNLQALRSPLIETRIQAVLNLQRFKDEFDSLDKELINDAISAEMVGHVRSSLNSLLIKTANKAKRYIEISDTMHIDIHVKDIYLINVNIAGTNYIDTSEIYNRLFEDDFVYLKREADNQYDQNAIQIITTEGYMIGYVPKENNFILKNLMDKGKYLYGKVKEISEDYNIINVNIYLSYKDVIEEVTNTLSLLSGEKENYLQ